MRMNTHLQLGLCRHDIPLLHDNFMHGSTRTSPARLRISTACRRQLVLFCDLFSLNLRLKVVWILIICLILKVWLIVGLFYLLVNHLIRLQNIGVRNRAVYYHFWNVFIILNIFHQIVLAGIISLSNIKLISELLRSRKFLSHHVLGIVL